MLSEFLIKKTISNDSVLVVHRFLKKRNVNFSLLDVKNFITEHQNYNSLLAVYDCLEWIGFSMNAVSIEDPSNHYNIIRNGIVQLKGENSEFFAYVKSISASGIVIYDKNDKVKILSLDEFKRKWTGILLYSESHNLNPLKIKKKIGIYTNFKLIFILLLIFGLFFSIIHRSNISIENIIIYYLFLFASILGLLLCTALYWYEIDKENLIVKNLCISQKSNGCTSVLNSSGASILGYFSLSEIGISYFFGSIIFLSLLNQNLLDTVQLYSQISLCTIPLIIYSIFYQAFQIKKWCSLCLMVQTILIIVVVTSFSLNPLVQPLRLELLLKFLTINAFLFITFNALKPILINNKNNSIIKRNYNKIKRDPELFFELLKKTLGISHAVGNTGLFFGNADAKYSVIKVCNPFCGPCALAHPPLERLLSDGIINLKIIFTSKPDPESFQNLPTFHFVALYKQNKKLAEEAIDYWYNSPEKDYKILSEKFPLEKKLILQSKKEVNVMHEWCKKENILFTPTIYLNNKKLPNRIQAEDLPHILY